MLNINQIKGLKNRKKIVMLTAYDYTMASFLEQAGVDIILVGDSLGMVFAGHKSTMPVSVEEMIYHTKAVKRGARNTFITVDMPFMSYQASIRDAKISAGKIMKETGANAVKLEGGEEVAVQVKEIVDMGIPVMGHIGLQPQSVNKYGGYTLQGTTEEEKAKLVKSAIALEKAGVFSIVVEKTKKETTREITKSVSVPVIGIGAGPFCDGQVLVTYDMLGFFEDFTPKFVKKYDNIAGRIKKAVKSFARDVKGKKFPGTKYSF